MADDGEHQASSSPVWERRGRRGGGNPLVGLIVTLLALFGALTAGLSIPERSVASAGARIDGWIAAGWDMVTGGADDVEAAAEDAGEAVAEGADQAAEELTGD